MLIRLLLRLSSSGHGLVTPFLDALFYKSKISLDPLHSFCAKTTVVSRSDMPSRATFNWKNVAVGLGNPVVTWYVYNTQGCGFEWHAECIFFVEFPLLFFHGRPRGFAAVASFGALNRAERVPRRRGWTSTVVNGWVVGTLTVVLTTNHVTVTPSGGQRVRMTFTIWMVSAGWYSVVRFLGRNTSRSDTLSHATRASS